MQTTNTSGFSSGASIPDASIFSSKISDRASIEGKSAKNQSSGPANNRSKRGFPFWLLIFLLLLFTTGISARSQKLLNAAQILTPGVGIDEIASSGTSGLNGVDGMNGQKGANGNDGRPGTNGEKGEDGSAGSAGVAGANGSAGADGAQGVAGSNDCISGICVSRQTTSPGTQESGNINIDGAILADSLTATILTATTIAGNGSGLTALNASNIASGTLADGRLSSNVTLLGNTFNGASQLVQLTGGGLLPGLNGSNLTTLNATNISSGSLADARLSANVALLNASNIFSVGQTILSGAAGTKGLVVQGSASQSANLQEWQNSAGTVLASVGSSGLINANQGLATWDGVVADGGIGPVSGGINTGIYGYNALIGYAGGVEKFRAVANKGVAVGRASTGNSGAVEKLGVGEWVTADDLATMMVTAGAATHKALVVQGYTSQTANLQEWQNSAGSVLAKVGSDGIVYANQGVIYSNYTENKIYVPGTDDLYVLGRGRVKLGRNGSPALTVQGAGEISVQVTGYAGQTTDLQQWQNSAGTVLNAIGSDGKFYFGDSSGVNTSKIYSPSGATVQIDHPGGAGTGTIVNFGGDRYNAGNYTFRTNASTQGVAIINSTAAQKALLIQGAASQSGNLTEWQNSSGTALASISSAGVVKGAKFSGFSGTTTWLSSDGTNTGLFVTDAANPQTGANRSFHITANGGQAVPAFSVTGGSTGQVVALVKGAASQTANLQEWQNSLGTALSVIDENGYIGVGTSDPLYELHVSQGSTWETELGITNTSSSKTLRFSTSGNATSNWNIVNAYGELFFYNTSLSEPTLELTDNGNVGIGTNFAAPTSKLTVKDSASAGSVLSLQNTAGTCTHTPTAGAETVSCSSDERLKTNITDAASVLSEINGLRIHDYTVIANGQQTTGLIAQEAINTHPEMVHMGEDGYYKVDSYNPWKVLKGIQELSSSQDNLLMQLTNAIDKTSGDIDATNELLANQGLRIDQLSATLDAYASQLSDHQTRIEILEAEIRALKQQ